MAAVNPNGGFTQQTISDAGVHALLTGRPLEPYMTGFIYYARQYDIDVNWAMSYLQWENGFGSAGPGGRHFSMDHNNPWDMLCFPGQWGADGCRDPGNGHSYATYPTMEVGIEAGYRQWRQYIMDGFDSWYASLCRASSGSGPCNEQWVQNVIATAQRNAELWPFGDGPDLNPPGDGGDEFPFLALVGLTVMAFAGVVLGTGLFPAAGRGSYGRDPRGGREWL